MRRKIAVADRLHDGAHGGGRVGDGANLRQLERHRPIARARADAVDAQADRRDIPVLREPDQLLDDLRAVAVEHALRGERALVARAARASGWVAALASLERHGA